jgi:superoxide reductase
MTELNQVYKCSVCGNIVEVVHASGGTLVCCGKNMELLNPNTTDAAQEKHVPVLKITKTAVKVKIGAKKHPMEVAHYIEWIEIIADGKVYRQYLKPGDKPQAVFKIVAENVVAREYCNLHGLWKA